MLKKKIEGGNCPLLHPRGSATGGEQGMVQKSPVPLKLALHAFI